MKKKKLYFKIKRVLGKNIPIGLVILILFNSLFGGAVLEYYLLKRNFNKTLLELAKTTKNPEELAQILKEQVLPQAGYNLGVVWGDIGKELLDSSAIDKQKFQDLFKNDPALDNFKYLENKSSEHMRINEKNSHFMVNVLWALGLINKSKVLDEGPMRVNGVETGNLASTGGWTLGKFSAMQLYSSKVLIGLTSQQEELVKKIAQNVFRPCCGNSTYFPDCNHGMAALGYIELAVKQNLSEEKIYKDLLALNSFWFPNQYVNLASYFSQQKIDWQKLDAKTVLGVNYSSAQGAQRIQQSIKNIPGITTGGGCGA